MCILKICTLSDPMEKKKTDTRETKTIVTIQKKKKKKRPNFQFEQFIYMPLPPLTSIENHGDESTCTSLAVNKICGHLEHHSKNTHTHIYIYIYFDQVKKARNLVIHLVFCEEAPADPYL